MTFLPEVLVVVLCIYCSNGQLTWKLIRNSTATVPPGRRDHAMAYDNENENLVIFGGRGGTMGDDTWIFNLGTREWRQVSGPSPPGRFSFVYGIHGNYFYISTGQSGPNLYNDIWRLDLSAKPETWEEVKPTGKGPAKVYGATGGFFNSSSRFYVSHGFSASVRYASTFVYDVGANTWTEVYPDENSYSPAHPHSRCLASGTMVDTDKLVIYGGCLSGGGTGGHCPSYDSWILDGATKDWSRFPNCASARTYSSLALLPSPVNHKRVILYGGEERGTQVLITEEAPADQVAVLNVEDKTWTLRRAQGSEIPPKRVGAAMVSHPNGVYVFGGSGLNDLWLLEGNATTADKAPEYGKCIGPFKGFFNLIMLHVVFMFSGWGILLQAGAFIARYLRSKDPLWFHLHRICQVSGIILSIAGFICGVASVKFDHFNFLHGGLGLVITIIGIQQPLNGIFRPHKIKGEGILLRRKIWEFIHLNSGRLALILAIINISLGLYLELASVATIVLWYVYLAVIVIAYIVMEVRLQLKKKTSNSSHDITMK